MNMKKIGFISSDLDVDLDNTIPSTEITIAVTALFP